MTKVSEFLEKMYEEPSQELENEMLEEIIMKANFLSYINRPDNGKTDVFSINMLLTDDKKLYYENGKLKLIANNKDGKMNGIVTTYSEDGKVIKKIEVKDGEVVREIQ